MLDGAVVVDRQDGSIASVSPLTGRTRWSAHLGTEPRDLAVAGDRLWVLLTRPRQAENKLVALDAATGHTIARIALPVTDARTIASSGSSLLVTTVRGDVLVVRPPR